MLRSECRRVFKDLMLLGLIFSALTAGCAWTDKASTLAPVLELVLLLFSAYMGWSILDRERQDGAVEYMLSLPLSRWGLLAQKFFPRLIAATAAMGAFLLVAFSLNLPTILDPWQLTGVAAAFFLVAVSLSLSLRNYISALFFIILIHPGQIMLMKLADPILPLSSAIEYAGITAVVLAAFFVFIFRTWDLHPSSMFNRRFIPYALLTVLLVPLLIFLAYGRSWGLYFLSNDGTLIRAACGRSEAVNDRGSWRFSTCLTALHDTDDGRLYLAKRFLKKGGPCRVTGIMRFNPADDSWEPVAPLPEGWRLLTGGQGETGVQAGRRHYFSMIHIQDPGRAAILEVEGLNWRLLPLDGEFSLKWFAILIAAERGNRFILEFEDLLWEWTPGDSPKKLPFTGDVALWGERILIMNEKEALVLKWSGDKLAEEHRFPGAAQWVRRWGGTARARHVLFQQGGKIRHVDMETSDSQVLEMEITPINYVHGPKGLTVVSRDEERIRVDTWDQEKHQIRYWKPSLDFRVIAAYDSGIIVYNSRHFEVYRFK